MNPEVETPEVEPETPPAAAERPEWLPDKFGSPEALAESYTHLESRLGQQGNELSAEREAREAAEARAAELEQLVAGQQQPQYDPAQDPLVAAFEHAYESGDARMMLAVQAELANRAAQAAAGTQPQEHQDDPQEFETAAVVAENQVWRKYGDEYGELREQVAQKLQDMPGLVAGSTLADFERGIETAFHLAQREKLLDTQTKQAQQEQQAEEARKAKLAAQTATGAGPRPIPKSEQEKVWEEIKNADDGRWKGAAG